MLRMQQPVLSEKKVRAQALKCQFPRFMMCARVSWGNFDGRLKGIEDKQARLSDALKELNEMMKKFTKESFVIKGTPREASSFTPSNFY